MQLCTAVQSEQVGAGECWAKEQGGWIKGTDVRDRESWILIPRVLFVLKQLQATNWPGFQAPTVTNPLPEALSPGRAS